MTAPKGSIHPSSPGCPSDLPPTQLFEFAKLLCLAFVSFASSCLIAAIVCTGCSTPDCHPTWHVGDSAAGRARLFFRARTCLRLRPRSPGAIDAAQHLAGPAMVNTHFDSLAGYTRSLTAVYLAGPSLLSLARADQAARRTRPVYKAKPSQLSLDSLINGDVNLLMGKERFASRKHDRAPLLLPPPTSRAGRPSSQRSSFTHTDAATCSGDGDSSSGG